MKKTEAKRDERYFMANYYRLLTSMDIIGPELANNIETIDGEERYYAIKITNYLDDNRKKYLKLLSESL